MTTNNVAFKSGDDCVKVTNWKLQERLNPAALIGHWYNTNPNSQAIQEVMLGTNNGQLTVQILGAVQPRPKDWGTVIGEMFALQVDSRHAKAFRAYYDFGYMDVHLQANIKQGVLVVASFAQFKDDSGRSNYFHREFFYKRDIIPHEA